MINNQVNDTFALFSNKQLIGGCLEFLQEGLKIALCEVVKAALNSGQTMSQFSLTTFDKWDLTTLLNFSITNFNDFTAFYNLSDPQLRTLLFELKTCRNNWAHQGEFTLRDVHRSCDTVQLFFERLGVDRTSVFFQKINYFREQACLRLAKEIVEKNSHHTHQSFDISSIVPNNPVTHTSVNTPIQHPIDEKKASVNNSNNFHHTGSHWQNGGSREDFSSYSKPVTTAPSNNTHSYNHTNNSTIGSQSYTIPKKTFNKFPDMLND